MAPGIGSGLDFDGTLSMGCAALEETWPSKSRFNTSGSGNALSSNEDDWPGKSGRVDLATCCHNAFSAALRYRFLDDMGSSNLGIVA